MRTPIIIASVLAVSVAVVSLSFDRYQAERQRRQLRDDLKAQATMLAESAQDAVEPYFEKRADPSLVRAIKRVSARPDVKGIAALTADVRRRANRAPAGSGQVREWPASQDRI